LEIIDDYTVNEPDATRPWYVTRIVEGGNLRKRLEPGKCYGGLEEIALDFFEKLVGAVKRLHASNVAHRDLKPENILLEKDEEIVLCDLGLCLPLDSELRGERLTVELERIGSIHYIPKEAFANPQPIGKVQFGYDAFAIGKILYELLAGKILPGFESPYNKDFDLSESRGGEFYAAVNLLLEGLINENQDTRIDTWARIDSSIDALKNMLKPTEKDDGTIEKFRRRLTIVSDSLHRSIHVEAKEKAYDIEQMKKRCEEICEKIANYWENHEFIRLIKDDFLEKNKNLADFVINKSDNLSQKLEGPFVRSRLGKKPLEEEGRTSGLEAIAEMTIGLNSKQQVEMDSIWLACSVFNQNERIKALLMLIRQKKSEPRFIGRNAEKLSHSPLRN